MKLDRIIDERGKLRSIRRRMVIDAKNRPCADCGIQYHRSVMEFDHLPEFTKNFGLSWWSAHSRKEIRAELDKCEVVCSNCHRIRTWNRKHPKDQIFARPSGDYDEVKNYGKVNPQPGVLVLKVFQT